MHTAFECSPILEWKSLPFQIESFDTWGKPVLSLPSARFPSKEVWTESELARMLEKEWE